MAMQLNPVKALVRGGGLGSPIQAQSGINNLLQMQGNTINDLTGTIGNVGKINRTETVNDLIARGGLEGMSEQQAQQKLLGTAGGSLTEQGQNSVNELLKSAGAEDQRGFSRDEQRQRQYEARDVAELLNTNKVKSADVLNTNKISNQERADRLQENNVFKTITGADGKEYGVTVGGKTIPLKDILLTDKSKGGSGSKEPRYKPTGNVKQVYDDSGAESKEVIEFFDNPMYNLQFKPSVYKDEKGKVHKNKGEGQFFFNGKETTLPQLREIKRITEQNLKRG